MIDFPDSPSLNQLYTTAGRTWRWNGVGWKIVDFLEPLSGPIGPIGASGPSGAGATGSTGPTGPRGINTSTLRTKMDIYGVSGPVHTTWYKPTGTQMVEVFLLGAGGGGGGGRSGSSSTNRNGGVGGNGGGYMHRIFNTNEVGNTEIVIVGQCGLGGAVSTNATNGQDTSFGTIAIAKGGLGGPAGGTLTTSTSAISEYNLGGFVGGAGGGGSTAGAGALPTGTGTINSKGGPGGGGGSGASSTNTVNSGGAGGANFVASVIAGQGGNVNGTTGPINGGLGYDSLFALFGLPMPGSGGGGGAAGFSAGLGGVGGWPAAGGGGGGGGAQAGGNGSSGLAVIISYI